MEIRRPPKISGISTPLKGFQKQHISPKTTTIRREALYFYWHQTIFGRKFSPKYRQIFTIEVGYGATLGKEHGQDFFLNTDCARFSTGEIVDEWKTRIRLSETFGSQLN